MRWDIRRVTTMQHAKMMAFDSSACVLTVSPDSDVKQVSQISARLCYTTVSLPRCVKTVPS
jgi:predicted adenine nucleotide alpha hydrolase (AANH) superfamily ATPase